MGKLKVFDYISRYSSENLGSKYAQTLNYKFVCLITSVWRENWAQLTHSKTFIKREEQNVAFLGMLSN